MSSSSNQYSSDSDESIEETISLPAGQTFGTAPQVAMHPQELSGPNIIANPGINTQPNIPPPPFNMPQRAPQNFPPPPPLVPSQNIPKFNPSIPPSQTPVSTNPIQITPLNMPRPGNFPIPVKPPQQGDLKMSALPAKFVIPSPPIINPTSIIPAKNEPKMPASQPINAKSVSSSSDSDSDSDSDTETYNHKPQEFKAQIPGMKPQAFNSPVPQAFNPPVPKAFNPPPQPVINPPNLVAFNPPPSIFNFQPPPAFNPQMQPNLPVSQFPLPPKMTGNIPIINPKVQSLEVKSNTSSSDSESEVEVTIENENPYATQPALSSPAPFLGNQKIPPKQPNNQFNPISQPPPLKPTKELDKAPVNLPPSLVNFDPSKQNKPINQPPSLVNPSPPIEPIKNEPAKELDKSSKPANQQPLSINFDLSKPIKSINQAQSQTTAPTPSDPPKPIKSINQPPSQINAPPPFEPIKKVPEKEQDKFPKPANQPPSLNLPAFENFKPPPSIANLPAPNPAIFNPPPVILKPVPAQEIKPQSNVSLSSSSSESEYEEAISDTRGEKINKVSKEQYFTTISKITEMLPHLLNHRQMFLCKYSNGIYSKLCNLVTNAPDPLKSSFSVLLSSFNCDRCGREFYEGVTACNHKLCKICAIEGLKKYTNCYILLTSNEEEQYHQMCPKCKKKLSEIDIKNIIGDQFDFYDRNRQERQAEQDRINQATKQYKQTKQETAGSSILCFSCKRPLINELCFQKDICKHQCKECLASDMRRGKTKCPVCQAVYSLEIASEQGTCEGCKNTVYYVGNYLTTVCDDHMLCSYCLNESYNAMKCKVCGKKFDSASLNKFAKILYAKCAICNRRKERDYFILKDCCNDDICIECQTTNKVSCIKCRSKLGDWAIQQIQFITAAQNN